MKKLFYCILFIVFSFSSFAQNEIKKANEAFDAHEYVFAITYYKSIFEKIDNDNDTKAFIAYRIGYCNRKIAKPLDAQLWFEKAIELKYQDPILFLYYADALRMNENFEKATEYYNQYKLYIPKDPLADKGIESCKIAKSWLKNPTEYIITNLIYLNSEYIDFSPNFVNDGNKNTLYFSSSRMGSQGDRTHGATGQSFSDIFTSTEDAKGAWSYPIALNQIINTPHEEGTPNIAQNFNTLYYTQCKYEENVSSSCKLMNANKINGSWEKTSEVNVSNIKKDTCEYAHPSISPNGLALYFASNRNGGYGGFDIWVCTRLKPTEPWGAAKNAGSNVNTSGDELFPYLRSDSILFFASNGHTGMGGLDIFRVNKDAKGREYILNLLPPINSSSDDYGITFKQAKEEGFFTSNRPGGKGYDDIYHFTLPILTYDIKGKIINEMTDAIIPYTNVRLIGSDGSSIEVFSDKDGNYSFSLNPQTNYVIIAIHDGFLNTKYKISTYGLQKDKTFDVNLYMTQTDMAIEVPNIMYDVNRWELRPESIVALEKLLDILRDNPHIVIELSSHTDYRVGRISNEELSQFRAQAVVNFLIAKGIDPKRLVAKGYGATKPKTIDLKYSELYSFLKLGDILNPEYIDKLPVTQRESCHQMNRRTEFRVISTDFHN